MKQKGQKGIKHQVDRISPVDSIPRRAFQTEVRAHGKVSRHEIA